MERRLRLRRTQDFQRLRKTGRVKRHPTMVLSYAPNDLSHNRYGFITSKRLGNAVVRNKIRRILREVMRELHPNLKSGFDIVIIGRSAIVEQPFSIVKRILYELVNRANLVSVEENLLL